MAREWLLRGVDPEELKKEPEKIPETPQSKWDNFWYHHKWTFWGVLFLVVALTAATVQMLTRDEADYSILMLTEDTYYISQQVDLLENMLAPYGQDVDGDGKVEVNIQNLQYDMDADLQHSSSVQLVSAHLAAGDVLFFICDEKTLDTFVGNVEEESSLGNDFLAVIPAESAGIQEGGKVYGWENDPRRVDDIADTFPKKLYFCVRAPIGSAADSTELYDQCMSLLKAFVEGAQNK